MALRRGAGLAMPGIAAPRAPGRKPWETVSMSHYQGPLVLWPGRSRIQAKPGAMGEGEGRLLTESGAPPWRQS